MMTDLPLDQVRTLLAVVDEGTFDAAAAVLHVTPSAVSQRVKALEQRTGRVLLLRTKPVRPTESGEAVVRFARRLAGLERDTRAELGMSGAGEPTRLSIAVNADSLATWFLPALTRVPGDLPLCYELRREDQDHTAALLREGLVMAAVTSSPEAVAGCSVHGLGRMRYVPVASPSFVGRWLGGRPGTPLREVLGDVPVVAFDRRDDLQDAFVRTLLHGGEAARGTPHGRRGASAVRHLVPTSEGFVGAVAAGMGWGMVPEVQADPLLRAGRFVRLAPDRHIDVPLFWQQWKLDFPALAAVARAVTAEAAEALDHDARTG
ncbi:LysR family transcriptional regulator (chromosome initiation inhibitor) [Streptomyces sp. V3I8]|uniref:LysR family transcriptional regulator ArgP n=1 Tax=Streptomyces sp. V3I8 TaxID=3042279 RepID=UPI0027869436|nr:LysR family transcriptional regulator ArgP [Streptomyces sp. V3I8]MDQ1040892.1 LysR family transcriptional regulator (chromosome initiation inhibitor) [Streptomyces sp. V3I8]